MGEEEIIMSSGCPQSFHPKADGAGCSHMLDCMTSYLHSDALSVHFGINISLDHPLMYSPQKQLGQASSFK
uniref:Uncharacterized protein n=1 Tax=Falco tinnunculus TaxID=100819 RepID=A0A8C4U5P5_FALTI